MSAGLTRAGLKRFVRFTPYEEPRTGIGDGSSWWFDGASAVRLAFTPRPAPTESFDAGMQIATRKAKAAVRGESNFLTRAIRIGARHYRQHYIEATEAVFPGCEWRTGAPHAIPGHRERGVCALAYVNDRLVAVVQALKWDR